MASGVLKAPSSKLEGTGPVPASSLAGASLPEGWHVDKTTGGLQRDTIHSMLRRREGWNYKGFGVYMVTLTLADRSHGWLGELVVEEAPPSKLGGTGHGTRELTPGARELAHECFPLPAPSDCRTALTPLGEAVAESWREISANWPGVEALDLQIMPEHLHGIIRVVKPQSHPLGQIVGSFKARATGKIKAMLGEASSSKLDGTGDKLSGTEAGTLGSVPASLLAGASLWSPGFQDSILWTEERRARATHYLKTNPYRLAIKRLFPELFKVSRELAVDLGEGRLGRFSAIGNQFLLETPVLAQVQCSRSFFTYRRDGRGRLLKDASPAVETEEFREKWALASKLASTGAALVSPCISEGEREIARRAFERGYKVITLANKGFSPLYKPGGRLFEQCAAGNLLMLAPIAWPYQPGEKKMTRTDALVLNEIAGWIVGEAPSSKLDGTGPSASGARELTPGARELAPGARELAHECFHYKGARVANVAQLAAAAVALSKVRAI